MTSPAVPETSRPRGRVVQSAISIGSFVALLWIIELVDTILGNGLDQFGVRPRSVDGLVGIVFAPLLHGGWQHLLANTGPLLVLGFVGLLSGASTWWRATAVIWVVSGVGAWLLGAPNSVHIGASGLVFGWVVYLIVRGVFTRSLLQILVGVGVLLAYGGVLWGVLPGQQGISWQMHLFGAAGGVVAALLLHKRDRADARR